MVWKRWVEGPYAGFIKNNNVRDKVNKRTSLFMQDMAAEEVPKGAWL